MGEFNIYCDESCHLENDSASVMILGAIIVPKEKVQEVHKRIREFKAKHLNKQYQEVKWTKISPKNTELYTDLVDYFFDDDDLRFRAVICNKENLDHKKHNQTHDEWYYKMYFQLLRRMINDSNNYYIYLDIKDTRSADKREKLHNVLCNNQYDFKQNFIKEIQHVRSHEVQTLQIADILIGAVGYSNRRLSGSEAKLKIINRIHERSNLSLEKSNYSEKFNIFLWNGQV